MFFKLFYIPITVLPLTPPLTPFTTPSLPLIHSLPMCKYYNGDSTKSGTLSWDTKALPLLKDEHGIQS